MQRSKRCFAVVGHFGGAARDYRIGVPRQGYWREMIKHEQQLLRRQRRWQRWRPPHRGSGARRFGQSILVTLPPQHHGDLQVVGVG